MSVSMSYDPQSVPVPHRLENRPRFRGYIVPFIVEYIDGEPDFRLPNLTRWTNCVLHGLCQLCGEEIGYWKYFVGGPESAQSHIYFDPAMHEDCALYALQVCPFLAMVRGYSQKTIPKSHGIIPEQSVNLPPRFGMGVARDFRIVSGQNTPLLRAGKWREVRWFVHGQETDRQFNPDY